MKKIMIIVISCLSFFLINDTAFAGSWNGWIYQNPYPTKNTLLAVKFVTPQKGWVVGEHGTILYTEDGGDNWEAQESGTEEDLRSVTFVNEKVGWAVGNGGVIIHTDDGGKKWVKQSDSKALLQAVFFLNEKEGWIGGRMGIFLHTKDGGKNWNKEDIGTRADIAGIFFINSNTGQVISGDKIYRTKDGGRSWETSEISSIKLPTTGGYVSPADSDWRWRVIFLNEKKGWAAVGFNHIYYTEDGGKTWQATEVSIDKVAIWGIAFANKSAGWAVGSEGQMWNTEDGGKSWKAKSRKDDRHSYFFDSKIGWNTKTDYKYYKGSIIKTEDGGKTWNIQKTFDSRADIRFFFINSTTGWAVGEEWGFGRSGSKLLNRFILNTNDGGKTWITQFKEPGISNEFMLLDVFFINSDIGWVGGYNGIILNTKNGGKNWEPQNSGTNLHITKIRFINDKIGIAIADNRIAVEDYTDIVPKALILHTDDGGEHWYKVWEKKVVNLVDLFFINNNVLIAGMIPDGALLIYSSDGGKTWIEKKIKDISLDSAFFIDKERGVILTEKDQMLVTKNGGKTWDKQRIPIRKYPWHISEIFKKNK